MVCAISLNLTYPITIPRRDGANWWKVEWKTVKSKKNRQTKDKTDIKKTP